MKKNVTHPDLREILPVKHLLLLSGASQVAQGKESACNAGDVGSVTGLGRSPGENGNPLQDSCLENPMDRGAWGRKELNTNEHARMLCYIMQEPQ